MMNKSGKNGKTGGKKDTRKPALPRVGKYYAEVKGVQGEQPYDRLDGPFKVDGMTDRQIFERHEDAQVIWVLLDGMHEPYRCDWRRAGLYDAPKKRSNGRKERPQKKASAKEVATNSQ